MTHSDLKQQISSILPEMVSIRQRLHSQPELGFQERQTSDLVAQLLQQWGYQVTRGIAHTGLVASLQVGNGNKCLGIRADMDALPIQEVASHHYRSVHQGKMHACGHDGHTASLLTAAKYLAEQQNFSGTLNLIFQPAEEGLGGGRKMIEEQLFQRFPCDFIYAYHNVPGIELGKVCLIEGTATAASDRARIIIKGKSGHGAKPQQAVDPIVVAASIVMSLQTIVSRNLDPLESGVISIGSLQAGDAYNIIPEQAELKLSIRSYSVEVRDLLEQRISALVHQQAASFGATAEIHYARNHPPVVNDRQATRLIRQVASALYGEEALVELKQPFSFSEDFSFLAEQCPGCYLFIGNGDSADLHNDHYDFNDQNLLTSAALWVSLAQSYLQ
jgi:hippurate hydrolase